MLFLQCGDYTFERLVVCAQRREVLLKGEDEVSVLAIHHCRVRVQVQVGSADEVVTPKLVCGGDIFFSKRAALICVERSVQLLLRFCRPEGEELLHVLLCVAPASCVLGLSIGADNV